MVQEITGASFSSPLEAFANRPISELCADDLRKAFVRNTNQSLTMYKTNPQEVSKSSLADCQMAFVTINNTKYPGHAIRQRNIKDMLRLYPNIKVLNAPWFETDWEDMRKLFASLRVPICFWQSHWKTGCDSKLTKGQVGRWLSLIMATAYLRASSHSCLLLFEDDVQPLDVSSEHLKSVAFTESKPKILRFGTWGEALAINRKGAEDYHEQIFKNGIWMESDLFMNSLLHGVMERDDSLTFKLLISASGKTGGIYNTEDVEETDFDYDAADTSINMMESLIQAFKRSDDMNYKFFKDSIDLPILHDFVGTSR